MINSTAPSAPVATFTWVRDPRILESADPLIRDSLRADIEAGPKATDVFTAPSTTTSLPTTSTFDDALRAAHQLSRQPGSYGRTVGVGVLQGADGAYSLSVLSDVRDAGRDQGMFFPEAFGGNYVAAVTPRDSSLRAVVGEGVELRFDGSTVDAPTPTPLP